MSASLPRPFRSDLLLTRKGARSTANTQDEVLTRYRQSTTDMSQVRTDATGAVIQSATYFLHRNEHCPFDRL